MKYNLEKITFFLLFLLAACQSDTERIEGYEVHGIDISRYQSRIKWDTVVMQGIHFAFVKATEGRQHIDTLFCDNWSEMKRVGVKRGAYHFFRPSVPADEQAQNFIEALDMEYGDLPPVIDIEVTDDLPREVIVENLKRLLYLVEVEYSIRPIIYTHFKYYNQYIAGEFTKYPIWIAKYGAIPPKLGAGKEWLFWQYGNRGIIKGIDGYVDFNVFNGNKSRLDSMCLSGAKLGDFL